MNSRGSWGGSGPPDWWKTTEEHFPLHEKNQRGEGIVQMTAHHNPAGVRFGLCCFCFCCQKDTSAAPDSCVVWKHVYILKRSSAFPPPPLSLPPPLQQAENWGEGWEPTHRRRSRAAAAPSLDGSMLRSFSCLSLKITLILCLLFLNYCWVLRESSSSWGRRRGHKVLEKQSILFPFSQPPCSHFQPSPSPISRSPVTPSSFWAAFITCWFTLSLPPKHLHPRQRLSRFVRIKCEGQPRSCCLNLLIIEPKGVWNWVWRLHQGHFLHATGRWWMSCLIAWFGCCIFFFF